MTNRVLLAGTPPMPARPPVVVAGGGERYFYVSRDDGGTWDTYDLLGDFGLSSYGTVINDPANNTGTCVRSPQHYKIIVTGDTQTHVVYTDDGGGTWQATNGVDEAHVPIQGGWSADGMFMLYGTQSSGMYRITDGRTLEFLPPSSAGDSFCDVSADGTRAYRVIWGEYQGVGYSTDQGGTWDTGSYTGTGGILRCSASGQQVMVTWQGAQFYRGVYASVNSGLSYSGVFRNVLAPTGVLTNDGRLAVISGPGGTMYYSVTGAVGLWDESFNVPELATAPYLRGSSIHGAGFLVTDSTQMYYWEPGEASLSYVGTAQGMASPFMTASGYVYYFDTGTGALMRSDQAMVYGQPGSFSPVLYPGGVYNTNLFY